jgi:protein SCO1/2
MGRPFRFAVLLALAWVSAWTVARYSATGLVLKVDRPNNSLVVSCEAIPGYMDAMVMPLTVRDAKTLASLAPGMTIDFSLVVDQKSSRAESIKIRQFESYANEPMQARRLQLLQGLGDAKAKPLDLGTEVPDFTLTDQAERTVSLSQFEGKVVAANFVYTRCPLPDFCYRLSNNLAQLQKRFSSQMGRDLVLLTITFDPVHDRPEAMATYAKAWNANPETWHFLTGSSADIDRICNLFGVSSWQDEGLLTHNMHTVVIDRRRKLVANIEGNQFSAKQLGDLVESVVKRAE